VARKRNTSPARLDARHCAPRDSVDALLGSWARRRPDLDFSPVAVVSRLARLRAHIDAALERRFQEHGLSAPSFAVLVTLARVDDGGGVSQRRLMAELGLTSGTVSVRMDRLVAEGLVDRRGDPSSARNTLISLTDRGRELFEHVVPAHLDNERTLLSALSTDELDILAGLLRKLLVEFEGSQPPADAGLHLGLTLAPAHVAMTLREAVGLPAVTGLLVRAVDSDGAAEGAGLRIGDVLTRAGRRPLHSITDLYAAIDDAAESGRLGLVLVRGAEDHSADLTLGDRQSAGVRALTPGRIATSEHRL
jgi:DNA-binding MarR family transcriptional regulator